MMKLFLFVAFLAFAAAAPGAILSPALTYSAYSAPVYSSGIHAAPYSAYSAYSVPLSYGYSGVYPYAYKAPYYAI